MAELDGPIHIHAAEQEKEVEECLAATGLRPVEWLLRNTPMDAAPAEGLCPFTGEPAVERILVARAY